MEFESVIGLEVHAELNTKTKIYCSCLNKFGGEVNTQTCPVCTGMPGSLPVLNKKVVEYAVKMGLALNCTINKLSKQDRKNYFYPDLPKAYQISQFDIPLCENGYVEFMHDGKIKRVGITRIHIEEDAGKLLHDDSFRGSLADYNRCGVPLIEIVSEPDIRSSSEARAYLETIKSILSYIDISDCKMQEGSIRCDVNVSVMPKGSDKFGTRCEMKNVNTFSGAARAIDFEINRQIKIIEQGGVIEQATRRWDDLKGESFELRSKENANDYRYFPEPDLCPIVISDEMIEQIEKQIPELPNVKMQRYINEYGLSQYDASLLCENKEKSEFFEGTLKLLNNTKDAAKAIANRILVDIGAILNERKCAISDLALTQKNLAQLIKLLSDKTISSTGGKAVMDVIIDKDKDPNIIIKELGLVQNNNEDEIKALVMEVLAENEPSVTAYKGGRTNALGYLVGQAMKKSKGRANPKIISDLILDELNK